MPAPIIGVTSNLLSAGNGRIASVAVGEAYIQSVLRAGGIPVIIPVGLSEPELRLLLSRLDGILLTGGGDIDPARFDGVPHPRVYDVDPRRDDLEIRLVQQAAERGTPFLGICRGIQAINVALGGSLYTDLADHLPGSLKHDHFPDIPRNFLAHEVAVTPESKLAKILGGSAFQVNSLHHQGVQRLAPGLTASAFAPDRVVEAVELQGHPFGIGVQWHPEWLQELAPQRQLFQALVAAANSESAR
jgi:putative glutamine amidotransferase